MLFIYKICTNLCWKWVRSWFNIFYHSRIWSFNVTLKKKYIFHSMILIRESISTGIYQDSTCQYVIEWDGRVPRLRSRKPWRTPKPKLLRLRTRYDQKHKMTYSYRFLMILKPFWSICRDFFFKINKSCIFIGAILVHSHKICISGALKGKRWSIIIRVILNHFSIYNVGPNVNSSETILYLYSTTWSDWGGSGSCKAGGKAEGDGDPTVRHRRGYWRDSIYRLCGFPSINLSWVLSILSTNKCVVLFHWVP